MARMHTDLFFCSMLHAQNLFYIHTPYTQKGVYSIFEYKTNFERDAFRFSMENLSGAIVIKVKQNKGVLSMCKVNVLS
jgi:hypothetical protein